MKCTPSYGQIEVAGFYITIVKEKNDKTLYEDYFSHFSECQKENSDQRNQKSNDSFFFIEREKDIKYSVVKGNENSMLLVSFLQTVLIHFDPIHNFIRPINSQAIANFMLFGFIYNVSQLALILNLDIRLDFLIALCCFDCRRLDDGTTSIHRV